MGKMTTIPVTWGEWLLTRAGWHYYSASESPTELSADAFLQSECISYVFSESLCPGLASVSGESGSIYSVMDLHVMEVLFIILLLVKV